jgi:hypothetical protein
MLIDQNGKIVYAPTYDYTRINFEQDFEDVLTGKKIIKENDGFKRFELS